MTSRNDIIIGLGIFYTILLGLTGLWDPDDISTSDESLDSGFIGWLSDQGEYTQDMADFLDNMTTNISGFPAVVNIVLFTPMGLLVIWLLVDLFIYVTPFIGN